MNNYLLAIGYPLGGIDTEKGVIFQIELESKLYRMSFEEFFAWRLCINGISYEQLKTIYFENLGSNNIEFDGIYNKLIKSNIIMSLDLSNDLDCYEQLKMIKPLRQGSGIGLMSKSSDYYIRLDNEIVTNSTNYTIWYLSNGNKTVNELIHDFCITFSAAKEEGINTVISSILELYQSKLVYLMR